MVEIRVLGPVDVYAGGQVVEPGRPQQQIVLASLAAEAGRPVSAEALVDRISGRAPPQRASQLLYTHVARIRRMLSSVHPGDPMAVRVARRSGGYVLEIPPERVDVHRFQRLVGRATGDRSASDRAAVLQEALALWRGEPLAGLSGAWVESIRHVWRQQRLAAILTWARARLEAGEPAAVVDPLLRELAEHPLVEPLQAVLMRALSATGRGAEALEHYATLRRKLADELGADPGQELRAAHRAILRGEPGAPDVVGSPAAAPAAPGGTSAPNGGRMAMPDGAADSGSRSPAQLPADVPAFTGREGELEQLDHLCDEPSTVVVAGTAGVGKTALVVRWAHRAVAAGRFPDGQLYVNLRGFDPERPLAPGDALGRLLAALGVPQRDIPPETDERAARYRGEVADRRMLIVLDNAADGRTGPAVAAGHRVRDAGDQPRQPGRGGGGARRRAAGPRSAAGC